MSDGPLEWLKTMMIIKGYTQQYDIDFEESFSPVVKMVTIRCILIVVANNVWWVFQLDLNNAYHHGYLNDNIYMTVPEGVKVQGNKVCKLNKSYIVWDKLQDTSLPS